MPQQIRHLRVVATASVTVLPSGDALEQEAPFEAAMHAKSPLSTEDHRALVLYLVRRTRDQALAEDLVQDAVVRMIALMKHEAVRNPRALAYRIAENLMINALKRRGRYPQVVIDDAIPDPSQVIEQTLLDREQVELLHAAIDRLPTKRREVLIRRRLHGQSHQQIADALGLSVASVEKHVVRAIASLRSDMERHGRSRGGRS